MTDTERDIRLAAFQVAMNTARTSAERQAAIDAFKGISRTAQEIRWMNWLRGSGEAWTPLEARAAGEGTNSAGGFLVPTRWDQQVIHYLREYDGLLGSFEVLHTAHGEPYIRSAYSEFSAAATDTENSAFTEGPYPTFAQQSWGQTPLYGASARLSFQLVQDAFRYATGVEASPSDFWTDPSLVRPDNGPLQSSGVAGRAPNDSLQATQPLDQLVSSALGESLGRALAPVVTTAVYSALNSAGSVGTYNAANAPTISSQQGGFLTLAAATPVQFGAGAATTELIANTISHDTALVMMQALDPAYLPGACWYMNVTQWGSVQRQVDSNRHVVMDPGGTRGTYMGYPVKVTAATTNAAASTVAGPVFGNLESAFTLRIVDDSMALLRSSEKYAEWLQMYYRLALRADVQVRDIRSAVTVKYAAT